MGTLAITRFETRRIGFRRKVRQKDFRHKLRTGPIAVTFLIVVFICIAALLYLTQANKLATRGYTLNELKQKKAELQIENERLNVESARLQAIGNVESKVKNDQWEKVDQVNYLPKPNENVAMEQ